jgi:hypothetical protein
MAAILTRVMRNLSMVLICISFMARDDEHFLMCFWPFGILSFENGLFSSVVHFFIGSLILGEISFFELPAYSSYQSCV